MTFKCGCKIKDKELKEKRKLISIEKLKNLTGQQAIDWAMEEFFARKEEEEKK